MFFLADNKPCYPSQDVISVGYLYTRSFYNLKHVCACAWICACVPVSQEYAHCVKSPGEQHTPSDDPDTIPETVSFPSYTALQSGTGSWDLIWYTDWAQGTAVWQQTTVFDGTLFIVLFSHFFIQSLSSFQKLCLPPRLHLWLYLDEDIWAWLASAAK